MHELSLPAAEDDGISSLSERDVHMVHRWVRQLETMGLPASVMREAHDEAPRLVDAKIKLYEDWSWDHLQPSGHQEASQTTSSEDVHRLRCQSVDN